MSDEAPKPQSSPDLSAPVELTQLDGIVDDLEPRIEAGEWAADELIKGRVAEDVTADLVGNGWSEDDAAEIVEEQRQATRRQRGVITRDDVVYAARKRHRKGMRVTSWIVLFVLVLFFFTMFSGYLNRMMRVLGL